jgi:hypothetical protein
MLIPPARHGGVTIARVTLSHHTPPRRLAIMAKKSRKKKARKKSAANHGKRPNA